MEYDTIFWMAIQSSLALGLIHGINPCGHSWLVLAPFVVGKKSGRQVSVLTSAFLLGTAMACIALGASLGAISQVIPTNMQWWVEIGTGVALAAIGIILIVKPSILHSHDHAHEHEHHTDKDHTEQATTCACHHHHHHSKKQQLTAVALLGVGFVNMIIPCPTVAIMYGYALDSGNIFKASLVFTAYALTTAIAVAAVIYAIYKVTTLLHKFQQGWIENAVMRIAGVLTLLFSTLSLAPLFA